MGGPIGGPMGGPIGGPMGYGDNRGHTAFDAMPRGNFIDMER
jgi:hypothetical protein